MNLDKFTIHIDPHAARDLKKLRKAHPEIIRVLISDIDNLASEPYAGKALKGDKKGCYSLADGGYRIIYEIYPSHKTVHIIRVGDRKDIYR